MRKILQSYYLFAILAVISWASAPLIFKATITSLNLGASVFWFLLFGGFFLTLIGCAKGEGKEILWKNFCIFAVIAGLAQSLHYLGYVGSLKSDQPVSLTITIVKTSAIFQVIFAVILPIIYLKINHRKREKTLSASATRKIAAILIGFAGALIVITNLQFGSFVLATPILFSLLAAVTWGFAMITLRESEQPYLLMTGASLLFAALFIPVLAPLFMKGSASLTTIFSASMSEWFWLFYLGAIPTALAVSLWVTALKRVRGHEHKVIVIDFLTPVLGVIASLLFFGDNLTGIFWIGFAIIILGVILATDEIFKTRKSRIRKEGKTIK